LKKLFNLFTFKPIFSTFFGGLFLNLAESQLTAKFFINLAEL